MSYQEELDRKHINGVILGTKPFIILRFYTVPVTDLASWRVLSVCTVYITYRQLWVIVIFKDFALTNNYLLSSTEWLRDMRVTIPKWKKPKREKE